VALEALGLLQLAGYPKIPRAETASRLDNPGALPFEWADPEVWPLYSSGHTQALRSVVRFRRSRRSTPSDRSDGLWAHLATFPESSSVNRPTSGAPASEEAGSTRAAEAAARPRAGDPRAGQVRPRTVT